MRFAILICGVTAALASAADAESSTEKAGTVVAVGLPVVAGGITLFKRDWQGTAQLVLSRALTIGTVYGLKYFVRECRPFA